jgi:hypothetical protein
MARYNDGTTYNSGARYGVEEARKRNMSQIRLGLGRLTLERKLTLGQNIITASTANPNVPGNTAVLAAFSTKQTELEGKLAAAVAARATSKTCTTEQYDAEAAWEDKLVALAAFTQSATAGEAAKIESAGFSVRGTPAPLPLPDQVMSLNVLLNGSPGHSKLNWQAVAGADGGAGQPGPDHRDELDAIDRLDEDDLCGQWSHGGTEVLVSRGGLQCRRPGPVERALVTSGDVRERGTRNAESAKGLIRPLADSEVGRGRASQLPSSNFALPTFDYAI